MGNGLAGRHEGDTRARILAAASEEFARHGYSGARIRAIVDAAGVNLAAVNYHFGGKDGLYRATLEALSRPADAALRGALDARGKSAESRLRRLIFGLLDDGTPASAAPRLSRILAHEAMDPERRDDHLLREVMRPRIELLRAVVRELAGPRVPEEEIALAAAGIAGQCLIQQYERWAIDLVFPDAARISAARSELARHIADFSMAGIAALAQKHRGSPPTSGGKALAVASTPPPKNVEILPILPLEGAGRRSGP